MRVASGSKLSLGQSNEATEGGDIARLKLAAHDALTLASAQGSREIASVEFGEGLHDCSFMYSR